MKKLMDPSLKLFLCAVFLTFFAMPDSAAAGESVHNIGQIKVIGKRQEHQLTATPQKTTIHLNDYQTIGIPQNVGDIIKGMPIIDYRGATSLVPDDDTLFMRGFSSNRFVTALDGSTIRKTGGRRGSHIVDYALLPPFLIESVEILPGPHSALYPGKSIGGVINFISRPPSRRKTLKPDATVSLGYSTYDTRNHSATLQGSLGNFTYDMGYQKYATNGYLRHNEADFDTVFGRLGWILPKDGYLTLTASYANIDRQRPVNNAPNDPNSNYDSKYPVVNGQDVSRGGFYDWQDPTWDKDAPSLRMDLALPTSLGIWRAKAFYNEEDRRNNKWDWVNSQDHNQGIYHDSWVTEWKNQGVTIFNEFKPVKGHVTTLGMDIVQCYDGDKDVDGGSENKRIENIAGFAQHKWKIIPRLTLTAGLRYTDNTIWVDNRGDSGGYDITGRYEGHEDIERNWSKFLPKSFLTYELDGLSHVLRDTSISAGISRIWRSPDYHGDYNPQGKPTGAWLDPEHGVGYDLVLNRRLIGDIKMKINYAFYEINDYMAANADPEYGIRQRGGWVPPEIRGTGQEWKDYHINLEQIERKGIEIQISGHLTDDLYFLLGYAWQDFKYDGDKYTVSASEEIDERPKHCVLARCTYKLSDVTSLTLDYEYQDAQVIENWEEISDGIYERYRTKIDSYNLLGLSIRHTLFENWQGIKQGVVRIYSQNLLNEEYRNMSAYPGTPVTVGTGITFKF